MGLAWNWRESGPCNVLIARQLSADYTLFKSSISEKQPSSCDIRAPLVRGIVCSQDDAVLVHVELLVAVWCSVNCRNCMRASCTSWCGDTRGLCAQQWVGLSDECTRLSFERRGAMLRTEPPALVDTPVVNCCYVRAGRCRAVRTERSRPTGNVSLV